MLEFQGAALHFLELNHSEMDALFAGDLATVLALTPRIEAAWKQRDAASIALRAHLSEHGC